MVAGTDGAAPTRTVASTWGGGACQNGEAVPAGTTAVRLWLEANILPRVGVTIRAGGRTVASGEAQAGPLGKVATVGVTTVPRRLRDARLCFAVARGVQEMDLIGGSAPDPAGGARTTKMTVEYLRPGSMSWWSLAGSVDRRIGLGRAPAGRWTALIPLALMALATLLTAGIVLRGLGRTRSGASICACVAFLCAASWSILTPPFQAPDEPSHFAYAQILAETGGLPRREASAFSPEEQTALADLDHEAVRFNAAIPTIATAAAQGRLERDLARGLSRVGGGAGVASPQPPLYYALLAIPYRLAAGGTLLDQLALMRLLSALMAGLTALFAFLFLREALPGRPQAWTVGGMCAALAPLLGFISGTVNPDAMLAAVGAALLYCLARGFRRGLTPRLAIAIGAVTAVGFMTKLNFIGLAPGALLALVLLARRAARESSSPRSAYGSLLLAVAIGWGPVIGYALANVLSGDPAFGLLSAGISGTSSHRGGPLEELSYIWQFYLFPLPGMTDYFPGVLPLRQLWFDRTIGVYGWLDTYFPSWVYGFALIPAGLIAVLCARELVRARAALRARASELISYAAICLGLLALIGMDSYLELPARPGVYSEPRYLLPLTALFAAVLALAARGAGRRWEAAAGTVLVTLCLAGGVFGQLLVVGRFYF